MERLEKLNDEAQEEYDHLEEPETEEQVFSSRAEALTKLDTLLSQASQYTQFLEDQLIRVHGQEYSEQDGGAKKPKVSIEEEVLLSQPKCLKGGLKAYQLTGFRWLTGLWENGLNGILADEMGLGKTIQTIALLAHLRELKVFGWRLIVVPLSTMTNWVSEIEKWAPDMPVKMYHGSKEERTKIRKELNSKKKKPAEIPVVVTTYEIACRDRKDLGSFNWTYLVVDEGHRLKNRNSKLFKELTKLVGTKAAIDGGCSKLLLTGTPLQNDLTELWSLLNFLLPQVFSSLSFFKAVFEMEGENGVPADETKIVLLQKEQSIVSKLHRILRPFMMRRLKSQVEKELPPKMEILIYCGMTKDQKELCESIKKGDLHDLLKATRAMNDKNDARTFLNVIMQLRKASNHPFLHFDPTETSKVTDERIVNSSGKMIVLDKMLTELHKRNHKVLIFSQFTTMLDLIDDYLRFLHPEWKYCRLDGSTHFTERKDLMTKFNGSDECFVFLLSTRAGGVGINLASADTVIIFDSDWNPHQDSQAQDRAHRIGQTRPVAVFRLLTANSVELKIIARANSKRKLERVVCRAHNTKQSELTTDELRDLLADDFSGHVLDVGEIEMETLSSCFMDRTKLFSRSFPLKGKGYEIVEHQASAIVGAIND